MRRTLLFSILLISNCAFAAVVLQSGRYSPTDLSLLSTNYLSLSDEELTFHARDNAEKHGVVVTSIYHSPTASLSTAMGDATEFLQPHLIVFDGVLTETLRSDIESIIGSPIAFHLPENGFIASFPMSRIPQLRELKKLVWVGPWSAPEFKVEGCHTASQLDDVAESDTPVFSNVDTDSDHISLEATGIHNNWAFLLTLPASEPKISLEAAVAVKNQLVAKFENAGISRSLFSLSVSDDGGILHLALNGRPRIWRKIVRIAATQPEITWIERSLKKDSNNLYAAEVMQGAGNADTLVWDHGIHGEGQIIGTGDSGIDYDHCFFRDPAHSIVANQMNMNHRKIVMYKVFPSATLGDSNGHGTHTAASIAGNLTQGVAGSSAVGNYKGLAYASKLYVSDLGASDGAMHLPSSLNSLFDGPYAAGVRIHSDSWGDQNPIQCTFDCQCTHEGRSVNDTECIATLGTRCCWYVNRYTTNAVEIDRYHWEHLDWIEVLSAGNDGGKAMNQTVAAPATAKNLVSVGSCGTANDGFDSSFDFRDLSDQIPSKYPSVDACCNANVADCCGTAWSSKYADTAKHSPDSVSGFSARGPTRPDGRTKPDLVAPGEFIVSGHSDDNLSSDQCGIQAPNGTNRAALKMDEGTSMAVPLVAGAAALVRQYFIDGYHNSQAYTPSGPLIKAMLMHSATPMTGKVNLDWDNLWADLPAAPNLYEGFGRLDLNRVLLFSDVSSEKLFIKDVSTLVCYTGDEYTWTFNTTSTSAFRATMVYSDYPSHPSAKTNLVNDIDLSIISASATHRPGPGNTADRLNNVERVEIASASDTQYSVKVKAHNVPSAPQKVALVVTGQVVEDSFRSILVARPTPVPTPTPTPAVSSAHPHSVSVSVSVLILLLSLVVHL